MKYGLIMENLTNYFGQNIKDKRIIITGGTTGIGKAIADLLISLGGRVLIFGRNHKDFKNAFDNIKQKFPDCELYGTPADVNKKEDVQKIMEMLKAEDISMSVLFCLSQPQICDIVTMQIRPHLQII